MNRCPLAIAILVSAAALGSSGCGAGKRLPDNPGAAYDGLRWSKVQAWELQGPLPERGPRIDGGELKVPTGAGSARFQLPLGDADPRIEPDPNEGEAEASEVDWAASADGAFRAGIVDGILRWEKACRRCKRGFKRVWKTRLPANSAVPPVVGPFRVYAGALDNRVYAFKRRNGHRVWDIGLGTRIDRPLAWLESEQALPLLLTIVRRERRAELLALNPLTGGTVTKYLFPEGTAVVGAPLALGDGRVAVAVQTYDRAEAGLWVLQIAAKSGPGQAPATVPYNERSERPPRRKAGSEPAPR